MPYKRQLCDHWGIGHDPDDEEPNRDAPNDENDEAYNDYIQDEASQLQQ
jgi:hypothetical protein